MKKITRFISTLLAVTFAILPLIGYCHQQKADDNKPSPYLIASSDLRNEQDNEGFSRILLESDEQPVYLSLISDFDAPCSGWMEGPDYDTDGVGCEWLITLDKCNPFEVFEGEITLTIENECAPLLFIKSPRGDAYNRVRTCKGYGYHLTGFYSIQYLEAMYGQEVYQAIPVPVDPERARVTHQLIFDQTCYSMPNE